MKAINEKNNNIHSSTTEITGADNFFFFPNNRMKDNFFLVSICAAIAEQISDPALCTYIGVKQKQKQTKKWGCFVS